MSWKHISGWVQVTSPEGPVDPGYGQRPPTDPGYGIPGGGWSPADPGYDRPSYGGRPDNSLPGAPGHIWGSLIRWLMRPQIDNDPSKPPGRPVQPLPPSPGHPGNKPPNGGKPPHPWTPGHWEPIDPGFGKPPLWGFITIDNGLPEPPEITPAPPTGPGPGVPPPVIDGGPVIPPPTTKPTPPGGEWVPVDPDYGKPVGPCPPVGGKPHPPLWAWIPDRPSFPKPTPGPTTTTFYPSDTVTVLASGGSGSVNITTDPAGSWTVDPASVPDWVTINPMSSQTSDKNLTYAAAVNSTGAPKQALIKVNDATFTINQGAV